MSSSRRNPALTVSTGRPAAVEDLRGAISDALWEKPIDDTALREAVWTNAAAELSLGTPLGYVIVVVTELVDAANITPISVRYHVTRQVTLWTIEKYFGDRGAPFSTDPMADPDDEVRPSRPSVVH